MRRLRDLKIRWKLLAVVLPLALVPAAVVGSLVGYIANEQAARGITKTSKADLDHMASFTLDLLNAHYQQFQVYKEDKKRTVQRDLACLVEFAHSLVDAVHGQFVAGKLTLDEARRQARQAIKRVNVGESGYLYAMTSAGELVAHLAREGDNVSGARDETGRYFIREMCRAAVSAPPGQVLHTVYPWRNEILGDRHPRRKAVAYRYFAPWDWIIAAGICLDETYEDEAYEARAFRELKERIKAKRVGDTGYIYAMTRGGRLTIHPFREGESLADARDENGRPFVREMCEKKNGWIRYPWRNEGEDAPRMKLVRYRYFEPWGWIVAVGSYEDEFYREARQIGGRIFHGMLALTLAVGLVSTVLVTWASKVLTEPIRRMREGIRRVQRGRLDVGLEVSSGDELGELAGAFNGMIQALEKNRELEADLTQQAKMASLGVLASGVAHEINNPLGVILGFAGYLEGKIPPDDPNHRYVAEIKRESTRCKRIVQDLLSYARIPRPALQETDLNGLMDQIVEFAENRPDLHGVEVVRRWHPHLPAVPVDPDQIRQVAMNLILNAAAAMAPGDRLTVATEPGEGRVELVFQDTGGGIPPEHLERIFEPFFTTRTRGTGLGLAISRQIVERHHGEMRVESRVGVGTTVVVSLPDRQEG
ncbi:MAG: cache domain-containing protein [Deferrisomatales bacterium]